MRFGGRPVLADPFRVELSEAWPVPPHFCKKPIFAVVPRKRGVLAFRLIVNLHPFINTNQGAQS